MDDQTTEDIEEVKNKENIDDANLSQGRQYHLYKNDPSKFIPKLYNFKVPKDTCFNETAIANSPPFWVLVDHLVGVVWKLYSKEKDGRKLGIMQLQWALEFIKMIKDGHGNLTKTLGEVKNTIEDALILKYANWPLEKKKDEIQTERKQLDGKSNLFEGLPQTSQSASFTLRDVMSRTSITTENVTPTILKKSAELPLDGLYDVNRCEGAATTKPSPLPDGAMKMEDVLKYLLFLKKEQQQRIFKEKNELERIEDAISLVEAGEFDIESWVKKSEGNVKTEDISKEKET